LITKVAFLSALLLTTPSAGLCSDTIDTKLVGRNNVWTVVRISRIRSQVRADSWRVQHTRGHILGAAPFTLYAIALKTAVRSSVRHASQCVRNVANIQNRTGIAAALILHVTSVLHRVAIHKGRLIHASVAGGTPRTRDSRVKITRLLASVRGAGIEVRLTTHGANGGGQARAINSNARAVYWVAATADAIHLGRVGARTTG